MKWPKAVIRSIFYLGLLAGLLLELVKSREVTRWISFFVLWRAGAKILPKPSSYDEQYYKYFSAFVKLSRPHHDKGMRLGVVCRC